MKFPNGTNGAKANPVPATPINFKKSRRSNPDFFVVSGLDNYISYKKSTYIFFVIKESTMITTCCD